MGEVCQHRGVSEKLGRYELVAKVAAGGMAEVYRAVLRGPDGFSKEYAIKKMLPQLSDDPVLVQMFLDEARLASQLTHPNICQIFELGFDEGRHYIAMEFLEGRVLSDLWKQAQQTGTPVDPMISAHIVARAAEGLAWAHERHGADDTPLGIVHRDVSPDNLMLTRDGQVKVLDFGIARASQRTTKTATGLVRGKVAFMAPEQIRGEVVDARADVFSLGVVLFGLLSNKPVFSRANDAQTMFAILGGELPPNGRDPRVPDALWVVARAALAVQPAQRVPSARALMTELDALVSRAGVDGRARVAALVKAMVVDASVAKTAVGPAPVADSWRETFATPGTAAPHAGLPSAQPTSTSERPRTAAMPVEHDVDLDFVDRRPRRVAQVVAGVVGLLVLGAAGLFWSRVPSRVEPVASAPTPAVAPTVVPEPRVETPAPAEVEPPRPDPVVAAPPVPPKPTPVKRADVTRGPRSRVRPEPTGATAHQPPEPKTALVTGTGRLTLDTQPWTQVYLGARLLGETPLEAVSVPAGHLTLRAVNPELKLERIIEIDVAPDQVVRLRKVW
jgi:serine/threonine-protein kinase